MDYIKSTKMDCEITKKSIWAGKRADMLFTTVKSHSDDKYTENEPYSSCVVVDNGYDGAGSDFVLRFDVTSCEYDNFKYVTIDTDRGKYKLTFNENGELYFNNENTLQSYAVDKWYSIGIYFGSGIAVEINGEICVKVGDKVSKINSVSLEMTGFPTYGPILQSSIGICNIRYNSETVDYENIKLKDTEYLLGAEDVIESVLDALTVETLAPLDGGFKIRHSLNFVKSGYEDITINYKTSDERYISKSGRVVRPKSNEENVQVTVTISVTDGVNVLEKSFEFIVLADEREVDPCYMSDEEFFGKFDAQSWTCDGKLDYKTMPEVEAAVKSGDYKKAKDALLAYYRNKPKNSVENQPMTEIDEGYADMILSSFHQLQQGYYMGSFDSTAQEAVLNPQLISESGSIAMSIRAWHNEVSEYVLEEKPVLKVKTDKNSYEFPAECVAMVKAGKYRDTNFFGITPVAVTYGDFLSSRTSYILLKFKISGIEKNEKLEKASLSVKGHTDFDNSKKMIIVKEFSSMWSPETVKFSELLYSVYSFEGLYDADKWSKPPYADMEYLWQASRFPYYSKILQKYDKYGDEELLYALKRNLYEAIVRFGGFRSSNSRYTYDEDGIRGGYTRTLDASGKFSLFTVAIDYMAKSEYADSEFFTAFIKHIWDTMNYLLTNCSRDMGNWTEFIFRGILNSASVLNEFKREFNGKDWLEDCIEVYESTARGCIFPDGSYMEGNSGYAQTALGNYVMVKEKIEQLGAEVSDYYNEIVKKNARYCANLFTASGESLQYGDCINYTREFYNDWEQICKMTGDEELKFIVTYGKEGKKPQSTMYHSEDSRLTVMRSDFSRDGVYLFTDVRGGGGHSHADENSVIVSAYGKTLLRDSGVFSYTPEEPNRIWGVSTKAHNTVEVDGKNQARYDFIHEVPKGKIHELYDDETMSKVSQSSYAYENVEHKRTIIFVKPALFVICDEMLPKDNEEHEYDVLWHFNANEMVELCGNVAETKGEGANIKIVNLTGENMTLQSGIIDLSYGQIEKAEYLSEKVTAKGTCRFINVIVPQKAGESRDVLAELSGNSIKITENGKAALIEI